MQAIEFKNVSFSYGDEDNRQEVLKDFSLTIEKGSFVALLGRNGSGKSTCAKLINGLLTPNKGTVTVFGMDTKDKKNLFENCAYFSPPLRVLAVMQPPLKKEQCN